MHNKMMINTVLLMFVCEFLTVVIIAIEVQQHTLQEVQQKFATPCYTPNNDVGLCVEVQKCSIFINSLASGNKQNHDFIRDSRCGPENEHMDQPKVCCGAHEDYLHKVPTSATPPASTIKRAKVSNNPFPKFCGNQTILTPSRIFGGTTADLGEFPWMARLRHKRAKDGVLNYGCAGFLISERFVLTAAHCIRSKALTPLGALYQVQLGEHNTLFDPDCTDFTGRKWCADSPQLIRTAKPIVHQEYSDNIQQYNDIALIPLKDPAKLTAFVYPICLADTLSQQPEMWLSGWGKTETRESNPTKLKVVIPRASRAECTTLYAPTGIRIVESQLCAGGEAGKDSCSGDSGGPIMTQIGSDPWYAEGIVSFGMGCGLEGWPGIYTSIPSHKAWIKKMANRYLKKHVQQINN